MTDIVQWNDIKNDFSGGSLLLANGASIAISTNFSYASLYEEAKRLGYLTKPVQEVFAKFDVEDFELVLRRLWQAKLVNEALGLPRGPVEVAYEEVRSALISTVRDVHVSYVEAEEHLKHIFKFLQQFNTVISLNYDLIVYWAAQYGNRELGRWFKDCFFGGSFRTDWDVLREPYGAKGTTLYFYPHGNLVLLREGFAGEQKIQALGGSDLLNTILRKWEDDNLVPAFVCEGTKENKQEAISSCNYLERVFFEVIPSLVDNLVIYGWGFGDQDDHLLQQIKKAGIKKVAVSVYGNDQVLIGNAEKKLSDIGINKITFFDSESEGCWNNPTKEFLDVQKRETKAINQLLNNIAGTAK